MDIKKLLELYVKNLKPNTKRSYKTTLKLWSEFLKKKGKTYESASTLDAYHFYDYISNRVGIDGRKAANGTVHSRIKTMRKVYKILVAEGICNHNIFETAMIQLRNPRENIKRQTQRVPLSSIKKLLTLPESTLRDNQDRCLIALMLASGLRISEALNLNLEDVKISDRNTRYLELKSTKAGIEQKQAVAVWANK